MRKKGHAKAPEEIPQHVYEEALRKLHEDDRKAALAEAGEPMDEPELAETFSDLNFKFFDGSVPQVLVKWTEPNQPPLAQNDRGGWYSACYSPETRTIFMSRDLSRKAVPGMLVHEMIHVIHGGDHGEEFAQALRDVLKKHGPIEGSDLIYLLHPTKD
jgi:hypothetical protein